LPAFPLDGGRVFRALLWRWKGKTKATRWAARTGRTFGLLMISAGVVEFAVRQSFDGIWIAFLGYFLLNAATAEEQVIVARDALAGITVGDAMSAAPVTVPGWITLDAFLDDFASQHHDQHFAVTAFDGSISGVVSLDAVKRVRPEERSATRTDRISIPIAEIIICEPSDLITGVLERMTGTGLGRALVFDEGRMVGALAAPDIKLVLDLVEMGARPRSESQS
ncbi:MAG: site-2 protease family protein, partial [Actinomycetota bacterium]